jgi:hypothetical protein
MPVPPKPVLKPTAKPTPPAPAKPVTTNGTKIKISAAVLKRMCDVNQFVIPEGIDIVFFGIRGAVPEHNVYDKNFKYTTEANVILHEYNHKNFRCTLVQWLVKENKIGLFIGSTVPGIGGMEDAIEGKSSVNMMLTGFYGDYIKGAHSPRPSTAHVAFRQNADHAVRRTKDDLTFESTDPLDYGLQHDNIHAAYTSDITKSPSASHGCQIILGIPKCERFAANTSAWAIFVAKAYTFTAQKTVPYILFEGKDFLKYGVDLAAKTFVRLRFGSQGAVVESLQKALVEKENKDLKISKTFDLDTLKAVNSFLVKQKRFDLEGVVGNLTATALGVVLPQV